MSLLTRTKTHPQIPNYHLNTDRSLPTIPHQVRALRECLVVIEKRETRYRVQWYYRLYEETQLGIAGSGKSSGTSSGASTVEQTHGSLLAFGEMLRHTGEFMLSRYKEVAETVLRLHESKVSFYFYFKFILISVWAM